MLRPSATVGYRARDVRIKERQSASDPQLRELEDRKLKTALELAPKAGPGILGSAPHEPILKKPRRAQ